MNPYDRDSFPRAVEAISQAQKVAYAPIMFQAARLLCKFDILSLIERSGDQGLTLEHIVSDTGLSIYGVDVLLSMGLSANLVFKKEDCFYITKTGYFLINDEMTRVNMAFTHDVCYKAMYHLEESIKAGKPAGLKELGDWETVYQGLSKLPDPARKSWFDFDHFYSDNAFPQALEFVFKGRPRTLFDVGGNTGKWSLACARFNEDVAITLLDLPVQLDVAGHDIEKAGYSHRITGCAIDLLDPSQPFPGTADIIWMSQFLDCFSPDEIISILTRAKTAMTPESSLFIMETLWDNQAFEAASYSLNATSLYFTAVANGNSRMYSEKQFTSLIRQAGLVVKEQYNDLGICHTLFQCQLPE